jgi:glycosyltransferase involved in cell wall biosynthesis
VINITRHRTAPDEDVYHPGSAPGLLLRLARLAPDVVHLHVGGIFPPRVQALALACTLLPSAASVFSLHSGGYPDSPEGRRASRATSEGRVLRRFDAVIGVNPTHDALFQRIGVAPDRVHRIAPHTLADTAGLAERRGRDDIDTFLARHAPTFVSVGLLEDEYDLPFQLDLLPELRRRHATAGLLLIGSGSRADDLRQCIEAHPHREAILLAGDVPHAATLRAIEAASVLLRTTRFDGDAVSVREALQLGTPVVATENGMRPDGVATYPVGDREACLQSIDRSLRAPRVRRADPGELSRVLSLYDALAGAAA